MLTEALEDIRALFHGGDSRTGPGTLIRKADVLLWAKENNLGVEETVSQVSVMLARAYMANELDWTFCDAAANNLFGAVLELDLGSDGTVEFPDQFWEFYLAFDHSETVAKEKADETARHGISDFLAKLQA